MKFNYIPMPRAELKDILLNYINEDTCDYYELMTAVERRAAQRCSEQKQIGYYIHPDSEYFAKRAVEVMHSLSNIWENAARSKPMKGTLTRCERCGNCNIHFRYVVTGEAKKYTTATQSDINFEYVFNDGHGYCLIAKKPHMIATCTNCHYSVLCDILKESKPVVPEDKCLVPIQYCQNNSCNNGTILHEGRMYDCGFCHDTPQSQYNQELK